VSIWLILAKNLRQSDPERRKPYRFTKAGGYWYKTIRGRRKYFLSLDGDLTNTDAPVVSSDN